ncbi:MAG: hypothetical protein GC185_08765 [Alphaproteobacteria bacterium]|nr:hypothetical protein [Alphaproteobacteria bacterium]
MFGKPRTIFENAARPPGPLAPPPVDAWKAVSSDDLKALKKLLGDNPALLREIRRVPIAHRQLVEMNLLHYAALVGSKEAVEMLDACGANIHAPTAPDGYTPAILAARAGKLATLEFLKLNGANLDAQARSRATALNEACTRGHAACAHFLLENKAKIKDSAGRFRLPDIVAAAEQGHREIVEDLLAHGAKIDTRDSAGRSALWWALYRGHHDLAQELMDRGADTSLSDDDGMTMLMAAIMGGGTDSARRLLDEGVPVNEGAKSGDTALHYTAYSNRKAAARDIAVLLLERGAWTDIKNNQGETPADSSRRMRDGDLTRTIEIAEKDAGRPSAQNMIPKRFMDGTCRTVKPMKPLQLKPRGKTNS